MRLDESAVRVDPAPAGFGLPLLARPERPGVPLVEYVRTHPEAVRRWLDRAGAVMFRGFGVTLDGLGPVTTALAGTPEAYVERSTPRTELADRVYTATDHPADQRIPLHNENSYQWQFPGLLAFCCLRPATSGGATPVADTRRVLARIPPAVLRPFAEHGVRYVRTFGAGLGLPWQEVFQTASRSAVTDYCRSRDIEVEWRPDGVLRTCQVRPAVAVHPRTGARVWFNHAAFFHPYALPAEVREALLRQVAEEDLPNVARYGDGRRIPRGVLAELVAAYAAEQVAVPWEAGDVLLVDNLLAAHGREPFSGERRVAVTMAGPIRWADVAASPDGVG
ncbi:TauD/TfdA family dioxygenase [Plantactinospora sp. KLBMP9567]|uniref:TauD/TfdA family dioxygenase n=1 Tax=Plantactinospora sp. KLBMP9567 TaxID=3085900 RepID=UPI0029815739|nr:TauD/TfdA family dioxygenase [Plantactinospora sp. KLBMP9567]MDW5324855.1 TauD/TfdA family dioxygenase [Plantactinospora sp. KLBMP9567]